MASTREREQISKPNIPREEKKKGESKNYWGTTFFFFFFLLFSFFLFWRAVAKHDFYGIVLHSGSVKSSQVRQEEEQGEQRAGRETRGRRGRQGLSVRVRMFLCVFCERVCAQSSIWEGRKICCCGCVCVYVQRGPFPHPPTTNIFCKDRLLRTKLFIDVFLFLKIVNVYSYSLVFCVLLFSFFLFYVLIVKL